jgi:ribosomal protein L22
MTDETEELTMAQTCRVYAASGMSVSFTPEKLNKLADAIEGAEVMLAEAAEVLEMSRKNNVISKKYLCCAAVAVVWSGLVAFGVIP